MSDIILEELVLLEAISRAISLVCKLEPVDSNNIGPYKRTSACMPGPEKLEIKLTPITSAANIGREMSQPGIRFAQHNTDLIIVIL